MKIILQAVMLASLASSGAIAQAPAVDQSAPAAGVGAVKDGMMIRSADGKRIGRIDTIRKAKDGTEVAAIIYDSRFVYVPVSTITVATSGGATTTLTRAEIK